MEPTLNPKDTAEGHGQQTGRQVGTSLTAQSGGGVEDLTSGSEGEMDSFLLQIYLFLLMLLLFLQGPLRVWNYCGLFLCLPHPPLVIMDYISEMPFSHFHQETCWVTTRGH